MCLLLSSTGEPGTSVPGLVTTLSEIDLSGTRDEKTRHLSRH